MHENLKIQNLIWIENFCNMQLNFEKLLLNWFMFELCLFNARLIKSASQLHDSVDFSKWFFKRYANCAYVIYLL